MAAHSRRGHRLAERLVLHIARREHARHVRRGRIGRGQDIALVVHVELPVEQRGRGGVADRDEQPVDRELALPARQALQPHARHRLGLAAAQHFGHARVPDRLDLGVGEQPRLVDLVGAQRVAPVDQIHFGGRNWSGTALPPPRCCRRRPPRPSCRGRRSRRTSRTRSRQHRAAASRTAAPASAPAHPSRSPAHRRHTSCRCRRWRRRAGRPSARRK